MDRRSFLAGAAAAVGAVTAGCAGGIVGSSTPAPEHDVGMRSSAFVPREIEVDVGDPVVWLNDNSRAHTVTAYEGTLPAGADYFASGGFDSEAAARSGYESGLEGSLYTGDTFEHAFEVAGTYDYFCIPHEVGGMVGRVVVRG